MKEPCIIVVGAGPCGIGAAWTLRHEFPHHPFALVDASLSGGGCAGSEVTPEGFTFDYGGHVLFPHKKYAHFSALLRRWIVDWTQSCPIRGVYMHRRLIPAPIQRNVHLLPKREFVPILLDLLRARLLRNVIADQNEACRGAERTLEEHLYESFGRELTKRVMQPLNQKMWTVHPADMSSVWVHERSGSQAKNIVSTDPGRLLKHALRGTNDPGWNHATMVDYPTNGGIGSIWNAALDGLGREHLRLGKPIVAINTKERRVIFDDGSALQYSNLISSMPLDTLLELCVDRPELRELGRGLRRSGALLFGFGVTGDVPKRYRGVHSLLCPEAELPFWRVTIPSNLSPGNVASRGPSYSILCEISCDPSQSLTIDTKLRQAVLDGLSSIGLLADAGRVTSTFEKSLRHGYPLPFLGRDALLAEIHRRLDPLNIVSRGRFGGWRYEVSNQDHAFMQGVEAVRHLIAGVPEVTYQCA